MDIISDFKRANKKVIEAIKQHTKLYDIKFFVVTEYGCDSENVSRSTTPAPTSVTKETNLEGLGEFLFLCLEVRCFLLAFVHFFF